LIIAFRWFKGGARRRRRLVRAFAVENAYRNQGACGQCSKSAAYLLDFQLIQITSALADQYSVLVIHACSPFNYWVHSSGPNLSKGFVWRRRQGRRPETASTAFVEISVNFAGRGHAAFGRRPETAAYLFHFLFRQVASASAH